MTRKNKELKKSGASTNEAKKDKDYHSAVFETGGNEVEVNDLK